MNTKKSKKVKKEICGWFMMCKNEATTTQKHPLLGDIPICKRCKDWYERMSKKS